MVQQKSGAPDLQGLLLVAVAGAWIVGMLIAFVLPLPPLALFSGAGGVLLLLLPCWHDSRARLVLLLLFWMLLGAWRYSSATPSADPQAISHFIGPQALTIRGAVSDEPKIQGRSRLLTIGVTAISRDSGSSWQDAHGLIEVQITGSFIEDPYGANYGDNVELSGKLQAAFVYSPPGIFASMSFPRIQVSDGSGNPILAFFYHLRVTLATITAQTLPQPEAALLTAVVLGLKTAAVKPLVLDFSESGTIHLIVTSGFKVTILAKLVMSSTRWLYRSEDMQGERLLPAQKRGGWGRGIATSLTIASILAYTVLSGAGPAAWRAGMMGILLVLAPRIGRIYNIYTALALTALLTSAFDPFVLWDISFQLSFLGTLGIVLLTPLFQRVLHPIERLPLGHIVAEMMAVTLAAQTATLPILAVTFQQISLIAPITNVLTVPMLGILILLGMLICGTGLLFAPLAMLCGWLTWPLLWYLAQVVTWCANLPLAYISVGNIDSSLSWCYYALLALLAGLALKKWPALPAHAASTLSQRTRHSIQLGAALLVIAATGVTALAAQPDGHLTMTFFDLAPAGQPPQGEAIFIRTPDGKTALIDGGLDATALSQALDSRLPSWQRSLDLVILTAPAADHLNGLLDVTNRYTIGAIFDGGMLHPTTTYARWRRTISERHIHYVQVSQGATIVLGTQVTLQVLLPTSNLYKGSNEVRSNGLVIRLLAPGLRILLLGATAYSTYALSELAYNIDDRYLQADIVQLVGEVHTAFPALLTEVLQKIGPSLLVITPASLSAKQRKTVTTTGVAPPVTAHLLIWQVVQTSQVGTIEIDKSTSGWNVQAAQM